MPASIFGDSYDTVPNAATIYSYFPRRTLAPDDSNRLSRWLYEMPYLLNAGGGLITSANEMASWIMALTSGRLIKANQLDSMWVPEKLNSGADGPWSAGWPTLQASPRRQAAGTGGNRSAFIVYPDEGLAIVVLTNLVFNPTASVPGPAGQHANTPTGRPPATASAKTKKARQASCLTGRRD